MPPTPLSPWYVVQRFLSLSNLGDMEYYTMANEPGEPDFTSNKGIAMLFPTFQTAMRIADATGADVRVLWNKEHVKEFGR